MKPYGFIDLKSAGETLQSSHLMIRQVLFIPMQAIPKWCELLCYVGGLLNREGQFVEMLVIINCEISYSRAKFGLVSRS